ncbi:MAG: MmcQ/YjbR family DNA-binding protein [Flavobacteriales bacterium]
MNIEDFRAYCLSKKETSEGTPFGPDALVLKVCGKMFALCDIENFVSINLKCEPERAMELREQYSGIQPGYHMSKKHWNTVMMDATVPLNLVRQMIDESYALVVKSLTKKEREKLA